MGAERARSPRQAHLAEYAGSHANFAAAFTPARPPQVMESWDDGDRIKRSMDAILELEAQVPTACCLLRAPALGSWTRCSLPRGRMLSSVLTRRQHAPLASQASATLQAQPGLLELLAFLRASGVKVGLVTRNTTESLNAFFAGGLPGERTHALAVGPVLNAGRPACMPCVVRGVVPALAQLAPSRFALWPVIGEEWRGVFDVLLTRDNTAFVKPDKRSLLHFAEVPRGVRGRQHAVQHTSTAQSSSCLWLGSRPWVHHTHSARPSRRQPVCAGVQAWGMRPWELLMVGDSTEDIETANAAGTASCLIAGGRRCMAAARRRDVWRQLANRACRVAWLLWPPFIAAPRDCCGRYLLPSPRSPRPSGGGNETSAAAAAAAPPRGAVPTFTVDSLAHLQRRLEQRDTALGWGAYGSGTLSLSSSDGEEAGGDGGASLAGAPPEGLDFLDALFALGAVQASAACAGWDVGVWVCGGEGWGAGWHGCRGPRLESETPVEHLRAPSAHTAAAVVALRRRPRFAPSRALTALGLACRPTRTRATVCSTLPAATVPSPSFCSAAACRRVLLSGAMGSLSPSDSRVASAAPQVACCLPACCIRSAVPNCPPSCLPFLPTGHWSGRGRGRGEAQGPSSCAAVSADAGSRSA